MPEIRIVCDACGTRTTVDRDAVGDALARHNDQRHDGDAEAYVDPAHFGRFRSA